jgi:hypothetical protein
MASFFRGDVCRFFVVDAVRHDDVYPVRLIADLLVNPAQFDLQAFGGMTGGAQHAEATCFSDFGNHVTAMTECKQGKLDTETLAKR